MTNTQSDALQAKESWLAPATAYASNADVDFSRSSEAIRFDRGFAWPATNGGLILRWNDRHGDLWNAWLPEGWTSNA